MSAVAVVPPGYAVAPSPSGELDRDEAAALLQGDAGDRLASAGFAGGAVRVLRNGAAFVTVAAIAVRDPSSARRLAEAEAAALRQSGSALVQGAPGLPAGRAYVLDARTRAGKDVLCEGAVAPHEARVVLVSTCGPYPNSTDLAVATAREVVQRLDRAAA